MDAPDYDPIAAEPSSGLQDLIGYRLTEWSEGLAVVALDIEPHHCNRSGVVHGGVLTTLIDSACGFSVSYCAYPGRVRRTVTLSLTTQFISAARGGRLRAVAHHYGGGRRICAAGARVLDADGALIATGEGMFRMRSGSEGPEGVPA